LSRSGLGSIPNWDGHPNPAKSGFGYFPDLDVTYVLRKKPNGRGQRGDSSYEAGSPAASRVVVVRDSEHPREWEHDGERASRSALKGRTAGTWY
jgi:hypothetical protein